MTDPTANDNGVDPDARPAQSSSSSGDAALLLVESLIHGLMERSLLSVSDAVEIMTTALDVSVAATAEGKVPAVRTTPNMLLAIRSSLERDLPRYR